MAWIFILETKDGRRRRTLLARNTTIWCATSTSAHLGYYCTESSEHNAEYNPWFIKSRYPEMIEEFNIPLDEYPRRCINQIEGWEKEREDILKDGKITHERSREYASYIMELS